MGEENDLSFSNTTFLFFPARYVLVGRVKSVSDVLSLPSSELCRGMSSLISSPVLSVLVITLGISNSSCDIGVDEAGSCLLPRYSFSPSKEGGSGCPRNHPEMFPQIELILAKM